MKKMSRNEKYQKFLRVVRENELRYNVHPDDLKAIAAFLLARARTKMLLAEVAAKACGFKDTPDDFVKYMEAQFGKKSTG